MSEEPNTLDVGEIGAAKVATEKAVIARTEANAAAVRPYEGVTSIQSMFKVLNDQRVANAMKRDELKDIAQIFDVGLPRGYSNELDIVALIRAKLNSQDPLPPTCDCAGRGLRWEQADRGEPVLVHLDPALDQVFPGTVMLMRERMEYVAGLTERLRFEFIADPAKCDILYDVTSEDESDGTNGTLGFTQFYRDGSEDLDVFGDTRWSVRVAMDFAERWTRGFIRTVGLHEILHSVGLAHIDIAGNVLQAFYGGVQFEMGPEELDALFNLYGEREIQAA